MPDPSTPPYSDATVELVAQVVRDERGCFSEAIAERVLDALAAAGLLRPDRAAELPTEIVEVVEWLLCHNLGPDAHPRIVLATARHDVAGTCPADHGDEVALGASVDSIDG